MWPYYPRPSTTTYRCGYSPPLPHGDCRFQVYESLVVNEYLAEKFPPGGELRARPLLPADPAGKAKARVVMQRSNDLVMAYFTYLSNKDEVRGVGLGEVDI